MQSSAQSDSKPHLPATPRLAGGSKDSADLAWNMFVELRKELLESQKIRAQVTGFKITFVTTALAVIATNSDKIGDDSNVLLIVPAFSAIFFDFLIASYSFSIKRIGAYCELFLEPILRSGYGVPGDVLMWQSFLKHGRTRQRLSIAGNIGLSLLAILAGIAGLLMPFHAYQSSVLLAVLIILSVLMVMAYNEPSKFRIAKLADFEPLKNSAEESLTGSAEEAESSIGDGIEKSC